MVEKIPNVENHGNMPEQPGGVSGAAKNLPEESASSIKYNPTSPPPLDPSPLHGQPKPIPAGLIVVAILVALMLAITGVILCMPSDSDDGTSDETTDDSYEPYVPDTTSNEYSVVKIVNLMYEDIYLARVYFDGILVWGAGPIGWEIDEYFRTKTFYEKYANGWTFPVVVSVDYLMYEGDTPNEYLIEDTLESWSVLAIFIDYDGVTYTMMAA